jgi:hypothetical protein
MLCGDRRCDRVHCSRGDRILPTAARVTAKAHASYFNPLGCCFYANPASIPLLLGNRLDRGKSHDQFVFNTLGQVLNSGPSPKSLCSLDEDGRAEAATGG